MRQRLLSIGNRSIKLVLEWTISIRFTFLPLVASPAWAARWLVGPFTCGRLATPPPPPLIKTPATPTPRSKQETAVPSRCVNIAPTCCPLFSRLPQFDFDFHRLTTIPHFFWSADSPVSAKNADKIPPIRSFWTANVNRRPGTSLTVSDLT